MKKLLFPFLLLISLLIAAACAPEKAKKPQQLRKPDLTGFSYYAVDSGLTVSLRFKDRLELDSMRIAFALVTSEETGEGRTLTETIKTSGKKLELHFSRSYFKNDAFYASMVAGEMQYPVKLFRIRAMPIKGEIVFENREKKKIHTEGKGTYIDQQVEKKSDGYLFTSIFDKPSVKNHRLLYYRN